MSIPFENLVLVVASSPVGRVFFSKKSNLTSLNMCINTKIILEDDIYVLFSGDLSGTVSKDRRIEGCSLNLCKYCRTYGLQNPPRYVNIKYSIGAVVSEFHFNVDDWIDLCSVSKTSKTLFKILTNIYSMPSTDACFDCDMYESCILKDVRRFCYPIKLNSKKFVDSPYFEPLPKAGVYPLLFIDGDTVLFNFTTIARQGGGIVQSGMKDKPRFYVAKYKQNLSKIRISKVLWELCYQYAIVRRYRINTVKIKPFIVTSNLHEQVHFGKGFTLVGNVLDYLWRTRPLLFLPFEGILSDKVPFSPSREIYPWGFNYKSIPNYTPVLLNQIMFGLIRLFGCAVSDEPCFNLTKI